MKIIPILFQPMMVEAWLAGRKHMTRRLIKWPKVPDWHDGDYEPNRVVKGISHKWWPEFNHRGHKPIKGINESSYQDINGPLKCPYGGPGDVLWVRESHYAWGCWTKDLFFEEVTGISKWKFHDFTVALKKKYHYSNNPPTEILTERKNEEYGWYKRPSIFMPYAAARIWLKNTDVKAERLQDISEADAINEGIEPVPSFESGAGVSKKQKYKNYHTHGYNELMPKASFQSLWLHINGAHSWHENPWLWCISAEVLSTTGKPDFITQ